ncbi:MAG: hypothetical protein MZV64_31240 [Ignavibacteriales bacterium]|nr:hypothetical protein [Ignavibacteriales bacterium]
MMRLYLLQSRSYHYCRRDVNRRSAPLVPEPSPDFRKSQRPAGAGSRRNSFPRCCAMPIALLSDSLASLQEAELVCEIEERARIYKKWQGIYSGRFHPAGPRHSSLRDGIQRCRQAERSLRVHGPARSNGNGESGAEPGTREPWRVLCALMPPSGTLSGRGVSSRILQRASRIVYHEIRRPI